MHPWDDPCRYNAALHEQTRINEEAAEHARADAKKGGGLGFLIFMIAVIFFKPIAEYCIKLYDTVAGYVHGIAAMFGL